MILNPDYGMAFEYVLYLYATGVNFWMLSGLFPSLLSARRTRQLSVICWAASSFMHIWYRAFWAQFIPFFPLKLIVETCLTVADGIIFTSWRRGGMLNKFAVCFFAIAVQYQLNMLVQMIISTAFKAPNGTPLFVILNRAFGTMSLMVIRRRALKYDEQVPAWHYIELAVLSFLSLFIAFFIPASGWQKVILNLLLLTVDFCALFLASDLAKMNKEKTESLLAGQRNMLTHQKAADALQYIEEARMFRHEANNRLLGMQYLLKEGKYKEVSEALDRMLLGEQKDMEMKVCSGNRTIDKLLNDKLRMVSDGRTDITVKALIPDDLPIDVLDVCTVLFNLLDNALEAGRNMEKPQIAISLQLAGGYLSIVVRNRIPESVLKKNPGLLTSKSEPSLHGYGLKAVRQIVERYNGLLDFYEEENMFCVGAMLRYEEYAGSN